MTCERDADPKAIVLSRGELDHAQTRQHLVSDHNDSSRGLEGRSAKPDDRLVAWATLGGTNKWHEWDEHCACAPVRIEIEAESRLESNVRQEAGLLGCSPVGARPSRSPSCVCLGSHLRPPTAVACSLPLSLPTVQDLAWVSALTLLDTYLPTTSFAVRSQRPSFNRIS